MKDTPYYTPNPDFSWDKVERASIVRVTAETERKALSTFNDFVETTGPEYLESPESVIDQAAKTSRLLKRFQGKGTVETMTSSAADGQADGVIVHTEWSIIHRTGIRRQMSSVVDMIHRAEETP